MPTMVKEREEKMRMKWLLLPALAVIPTVASAQGLPTQKVLTIDVAQTIAQEAMAACRANGYKVTVTVTVVDGANVLKAFLRDDGAPPITVEIGRLKANTAMAFGRPSGPPPNAQAGQPAPPPMLPSLTNAAGGLPIKAGDELIGAVSVSGAPGGDKDAACVNTALEKVADKLK